MKKIVMIIVIVIAILALAIGAIMVMGDDNDNNTNNTAQTEQNADTNNNQTEQSNNDQLQETNLLGLTATGNATRCTFEYSGESGQGTGTMYSDGEGRGRMQIMYTSSDGVEGEINNIITADKAYTWTITDEGTFGLVFDTSDIQTTADNGNGNTQAETAKEDYEVDCSDWDVDEALLTVPTDINFMSLPTTAQ